MAATEAKPAKFGCAHEAGLPMRDMIMNAVLGLVPQFRPTEAQRRRAEEDKKVAQRARTART